MKKFVFMMMVLALLTACSSDESEQTAASGTKDISFNVRHNYETRAELISDGNALTDLWIFDYMNGELKQTMHQSNTDADFAEPTISLAYGEHHIYFVASRGTSPVVDIDAKTIVFSSVRDTFWKDYSINVESTTTTDRYVILDRIVTRLRVAVDDEVPASVTTINVSLAQWHAGVNYTTGEPVDGGAKDYSIEVPMSYRGTTGKLAVSYFGFSGSSEWNTDVTITANSASGVLGNVTIPAVPFKRNRISELHGNLFGSSGNTSIGINDQWGSNYTATW